MNDANRSHLQELADQLNGHTDAGPRAEELREQVRSAIESGEHDSLRDRLMEDAVAFENEYPDLSAVVLRAAQLLGGAGL